MPDYQPIRQYIVFDPTRVFGEEPDVELFTIQHVFDTFQRLLARAGITIASSDYQFNSIPVVDFFPGDIRLETPPPKVPPSVVGVTSPDRDAALRVRRAFVDLIKVEPAVESIGIDPSLGISQFGVPTASTGALFGTLAGARGLIRSDKLPDLEAGDDVNVVVIDSGFDRRIVPNGQFGGGWQPNPMEPTLPPPPKPGMTIGTDGLHGMMMVDTILGI